jgi:hypothetical protein
MEWGWGMVVFKETEPKHLERMGRLPNSSIEAM